MFNKEFLRARFERVLRGFLPFTLLLLTIEFFDELHYGISGAVLPALRNDLGLTYTQAGLLLGLPLILAGFLEPVLMLLGDTHFRKPLIVAGGVTFAASSLLLAFATDYQTALVAEILLFPASGAFVTLSQATLIDRNPGREPQMMARWSVFGALGNLGGPLIAAAVFGLGFGWRTNYLMIAILGLSLTLPVIWMRFGHPNGPMDKAVKKKPEDKVSIQIRGLLIHLGLLLRDKKVMRWMILLQFSDLLLDVHLSYSALYFADIGGMSTAQIGLALGVMTAGDLVGSLVLIPLLERIPGRQLVRHTAWIAGGLYAASLLAPWGWVKIGLSVAVRFSTLGWYEVLQGEAYAAAPNRSGTVMAIQSITGLLGGGLIWLISLTAERIGLPAAMPLLLIGPLALVLWTPRAEVKR